MKILVCGGRDYGTRRSDYHVLSAEERQKADELAFAHRNTLTLFLNDLNSERGPFNLVITGGARGADTLAVNWARVRGIQDVICNANWEKYGKRAGYIRNAAMLYLQPDLVVAFPGGRGTEAMVKLASEAGVEVLSVR